MTDTRLCVLLWFDAPDGYIPRFICRWYEVWI